MEAFDISEDIFNLFCELNMYHNFENFHELAVVIPLDVFVDVDDEGVDRIGFKFCMHC